MRSATKLACLVALAASVAGCGASADPETPPDGVPAAGEWFPLATEDFVAQPGDEGFACRFITLERDLHLSGIRALSPPGTHHVLLSVATPEEVPKCSGAAAGRRVLFGAGVGSDPMQLPDGVALELKAGESLLLNLHFYNTTGDALAGTAGIEITTADAAGVEHEAEVVATGKDSDLVVPPGDSTAHGTCTMVGDATLFAAYPHMHKLGTHMSVSARTTTGTTIPMLDQDYDFAEQRFMAFSPLLELAKGDRVDVDCSYKNPGNTDVHFGESTDDEMCFAFLYRYPKLAKLPVCLH